MSLLESIVTDKRVETQLRKEQAAVPVLEKMDHFGRKCLSLVGSICSPRASGVIAEFKRRSPSRGSLAEDADVKTITRGYADAGASAISILTDKKYFGGSIDDLTAARSVVDIPVLRKDFLVEEYQVVEAKSAGADAILLIVRLLTPLELLRLTLLSHRLGMEVLTEIHHEDELMPAIDAGSDLIGINHRDLDTLAIDSGLSERLGPRLPAGTPCVAESGLHSVDTIKRLKQVGIQGFLIGEYFLAGPDPATRCRELISQISHED